MTPPDSGQARSSVAVALIRRGSRWAVATRSSSDALNGLWEFPGGRIEPGEDARTAAVRETAEETGLKTIAIDELPTVTHDYGTVVVEIHPVICELTGDASGAPQVRWTSIEELRELAMPPANAAIIEALAAYVAERGPDASGATDPHA
jgi:8-oxo-dGTP diphosphatase